MKHIEEGRLEEDLMYRFEYLTEFMGFTQEDIDTIHGAAPLLAPLVPGLVDAVYHKLYQYDATWRHFLPRQSGYLDEIPGTLEALGPDHPQIAFRKGHLARYLEALVTRPYDARMVKYLDMVGRIHTDNAGSRQINVPLVQMNALMGFVADAFCATILGADLPEDARAAALRAFNKLLWLQNDLIVRHYAR